MLAFRVCEANCDPVHCIQKDVSPVVWLYQKTSPFPSPSKSAPSFVLGREPFGSRWFTKGA